MKPRFEKDAQGYPTQEQPKPKDEFDDEWEATKKRHTKPDGSIDWDAISAETATKVENDFAPRNAYTFRNIGGQGLPDQIVQGTGLEEDDESYTVVDRESRQRFLKTGWELE